MIFILICKSFRTFVVMKQLLTSLLLLLAAGSSAAQSCIGIAYYDIGVLYDTKPSLFYDDSRWCEGGREQWNETRFHHSAERIAQLIKEMNMPIIALKGVENLEVSLYIAELTEMFYTVAHHEMPSRNGTDYALLYFADVLQVENIRCDYETLAVECLIADTPSLVILSDDQGYTRQLIEHYKLHQPERKIIVMGGVENPAPTMQNLLFKEEQKGYGTRVVNHRWQMQSRIWADDSIEAVGAGIFTHKMLLDKSLSRPLSLIDTTTNSSSQRANLPVFAYLWL